MNKTDANEVPSTFQRETYVHFHSWMDSYKSSMNTIRDSNYEQDLIQQNTTEVGVG